MTGGPTMREPPQVPLHPVLRPDEGEVDRVMTICNACRYCEGFCGVFPAMERRLDFARGDVHFLANLCHNCGACLYACQYAPPHAFAVNVPVALARVRAITYEQYAWPSALGALYRHQGGWLLAATIAAFIVLIATVGILGGSGSEVQAGDFYGVLPHGAMAALFGAVTLWIVLAFVLGVRQFWRDMPHRRQPAAAPGAAREATGRALSLRYLDGGGPGCNEVDDRPTHARRHCHHATFYGFMACFAATLVATFYHFVLGQRAPYPLLSLPVVLGIIGGVGLIVGPLGLLALHRKRDPNMGDARQRPMDAGFLVLLLATSVTGLALLAFRASGAMPALLTVHLAVVLALFVTLPYGKFAHAVFRAAALLFDAIEKRQPSTISLKLD